MRAPRIVVVLSLLCACSGPDAPDAELCADLIHRVCAAPVCIAVERDLELTGTCEAALLLQTGCAGETFSFTTPTRERFLSCRRPLLRQGVDRETHPACEDVDEAFVQCPDLVQFLNGGAP